MKVFHTRHHFPELVVTSVFLCCTVTITLQPQTIKNIVSRLKRPLSPRTWYCYCLENGTILGSRLQARREGVTVARNEREVVQVMDGQSGILFVYIQIPDDPGLGRLTEIYKFIGPVLVLRYEPSYRLDRISPHQLSSRRTHTRSFCCKPFSRPRQMVMKRSSINSNA
ncbi:hypothetical protein ARMGADRAFT_692386 [Armillaria gallica]|uniref:Uncharacterized protein n=1 Tax=Armillaria gallica TaxID=47427 RepID=A0A2H3DR39_ARMGA|nr:hypothetical protein ARMGADRAFT_692386 [Armillaria gallica]